MTETYTYDAFGTLTYIQSLNEEGVLAQTDTAFSRFLYAGEQYDEVSGLYYLRARRYDTTVGRFTQEDTYLGDGRNLYVYVQNNPLKYVDPSGHDKKYERIGDGLFNFASGISMALTGTAATIVATTLALTATVAGGPVLAVVGTVVMVATAAMGAGMAVMGVSDATQGAMEVYNAVTGNPDPAPNLIRDTVFGGNQEAYIQAEAMLSFGTTVGLTAIAALPLVITTSASGAISYYAHLNTSGSGSTSEVYIPIDADGNPIALSKQNVNGQDIPVPDTNASGSHTVLGGTVSSKTGEVYRQSATFPDGTWPTANGQNVPWSEVHWTDHGTPYHHTNPHQHIFEYNPDKGGWYRNEPTPY